MVDSYQVGIKGSDPGQPPYILTAKKIIVLQKRASEWWNAKFLNYNMLRPCYRLNKAYFKHYMWLLAA